MSLNYAYELEPEPEPEPVVERSRSRSRSRSRGRSRSKSRGRSRSRSPRRSRSKAPWRPPHWAPKQKRKVTLRDAWGEYTPFMEKQLATTKPWEPPPPGLTKDQFLGYYGIIAGQDDYDEHVSPEVHEELEQKWKEYRGYGGKRRSKKSKSKKSKSKSSRRGRGRRQRGGQGPAVALNPPPLSPAQDILNR